jgi:ABC-2 type transport system permease protein
MYDIKPVYASLSTMIGREFKRFFSEPSRIVGMLVQPLLFLLVFGLGFHKSFSWSKINEASYAAFFYPGILALVVLFAAIYATLTLVDDKRCGFFLLSITAPGGVFGALLGKIIATTILAFLQALLFLPVMFFLSLSLSAQAFFCLLGFLFLGSLCLAILGVMLAWLSPSSSAFHALMSIILIPSWLLSGAMFPLEDIKLKVLARFNPMSYLVDALRELFFMHSTSFTNAIFLLIYGFVFSVLLCIAVRKKPIY